MHFGCQINNPVDLGSWEYDRWSHGYMGLPGSFKEDYNLKKAASLGAPFGVILTNFDESLGMHLARELNFSMVTRDFESGVSRAISWRSRGAANFARLVAFWSRFCRFQSFQRGIGEGMLTGPKC